MNKTIPLTLPEGVWGKLATKADKEGRKVADLIGDAVAAVLDPTPHVVYVPAVAVPHRPTTNADIWTAMVAKAHEDGWTDREMAVEFERQSPTDGWTRSRISDIRRRLKLPANK